MFGLGCDCFYWKKVSDFYLSEPQPFSLPAPLPKWPQGQGFATGRICIGEIEVLKITQFKSIWSYSQVLHGKTKGVTFYEPADIPRGFFCLGHYCQPNDQSLRGYVLLARSVSASETEYMNDSVLGSPALRQPLKYTLLWSNDSHDNGSGYVWLPNPPPGYKAMGFVVTDNPGEPKLEEVRCVREDLTENCETCEQILSTDTESSESPFQVWNIRPCKRGITGRGVSVGTFFCSTILSSDGELDIACLKNLDATLHAMPNLNQIHALIKNYGPTVFFHPDEVYLPSSVPWFFKNGALLYQDGEPKGKPIDSKGLNLPSGGRDDGKFWIGLPDDEEARNYLKRGNLESAELYVHVKPALGGTFTDIVMWVFCPFNGPCTVKVGLVSIEMYKIGQHVCDWEHFTLRVSNFTGEIWCTYFSQHSGGKWMDASNLEYIEGNKQIIYSAKDAHASYPHPGIYLQGLSKLGIGVRNDAAKSNIYVDSSTKYQIIAAEYLGGGVTEPCWLQYMRKWGPTTVYDARSELDKIINLLPFYVRFSVENLIDSFPAELYGEEGPTGPKQKDNWVGDERC